MRSKFHWKWCFFGFRKFIRKPSSVRAFFILLFSIKLIYKISPKIQKYSFQIFIGFGVGVHSSEPGCEFIFSVDIFLCMYYVKYTERTKKVLLNYYSTQGYKYNTIPWTKGWPVELCLCSRESFALNNGVLEQSNWKSNALVQCT